MTLLTLPSLPGMAWLDNTTTSSSFSFNHLFSPRAISPSADIGSPCDPVEMMHTLPGSYLSMSSMSTIDDSGRSRMPEIEPEPHVLLHAQPERGDDATVGDRRGGDLLDAVQVAGEAGRDDPLAALLREQRAQHAADAGLARRVPVPPRRSSSRSSATGCRAPSPAGRSGRGRCADGRPGSGRS